MEHLTKLKNELAQAKQSYKLLRQESERLLSGFKNEYPNNSNLFPLSLARNPDKSHTPLFWRYSVMIKKKEGLRAKVDDFWIQVRKMNEKDCANLAEYELGRIRLNYEIGICAYKVLKLEQLVKSLESWENHVRKTTGDEK